MISGVKSESEAVSFEWRKGEIVESVRTAETQTPAGIESRNSEKNETIRL